MAARKGKLNRAVKSKEANPPLSPAGAPKAPTGSKLKDYSKISQIDGTHPWQAVVPEGYVLYQTRELKQGKILYFNFQLAKDMGLIAPLHPHQVTPELAETLVETFSIRIINEHDELTRRRFPQQHKKPHPYMATRYLQLQHPNRQGRTSGDGRSIWNGIVRHQGHMWDVSSRGTGVTCLSPGSVLAGKPLASGDYSVGYGCGTADIDELIGAALMSEIYHHQGLKTERTLAIIDLDGNVGIGVRAAPNLIRPAHLFMHLKQENWSAAKRSVDYLLERQVRNREWKLVRGKNRYWQMAQVMSRQFAWFTARLDVDYIFAWLDWDGDNVLCNAGIIDYGSIRQFGLRHDQYRYDDIERFSTTLNEQRKKARLIVQTLTQLADFVVHKRRRPLEAFRNHAIVRAFDREFERGLLYWRFYRMGLNEAQIQSALELRTPWIRHLMNDYTYIERKKTHRPLFQVADGVHRPAILNLRHLLRKLPEAIFLQPDLTRPALSTRQMFDLILSAEAKGKDRKFNGEVQKRLERFERNYRQLLQTLTFSKQGKNSLAQLGERAALLNRADRMTGNGIENVVQILLDAHKKGYSPQELQKTMESFIEDQVLNPDCRDRFRNPEPLKDSKLFSQLQAVIEEFQEDI